MDEEMFLIQIAQILTKHLSEVAGFSYSKQAKEVSLLLNDGKSYLLKVMPEHFNIELAGQSTFSL